MPHKPAPHPFPPHAPHRILPNRQITKSPNRQITPPRAFTLIEIMVVVIVIGVIAALIVPNLFDKAGKAKRSVAKQQVATLENAVQLFQQDYGRFPDTLDELAAPPTDAEGQGSPPSIKKKDLSDPWGNPFVYRYPGNNWTFDLLSLGADGQEGGDGEAKDITNY